MTPSERLWECGFLGFAGPSSREMDHFIMDEGVGEKASGRFEIVRARSFTRADAGFRMTSFFIALPGRGVRIYLGVPGHTELRSADSRGGCPHVRLGRAKFSGICYLFGFLLVAFIKER
jgi:hypothetical protein